MRSCAATRPLTLFGCGRAALRCGMLVLVPTALELDRLVPELAPWSPSAPPRSWRTTAHGERVDVVACGFGQASAGARAAALMLRHDGAAVLAGLAGTLDSAAFPVGSALVASSVVPHGIGVGEGSRHSGIE